MKGFEIYGFLGLVGWASECTRGRSRAGAGLVCCTRGNVGACQAYFARDFILWCEALFLDGFDFFLGGPNGHLDIQNMSYFQTWFFDSFPCLRVCEKSFPGWEPSNNSRAFIPWFQM